MIKALFDKVTTFADSTFYDVSTWNLPCSFNVAYTEIGSLKEAQYSSRAATFKTEGEIIGGKSSVLIFFTGTNILRQKRFTHCKMPD